MQKRNGEQTGRRSRSLVNHAGAQRLQKCRHPVHRSTAENTGHSRMGLRATGLQSQCSSLSFHGWLFSMTMRPSHSAALAQQAAGGFAPAARWRWMWVMPAYSCTICSQHMTMFCTSSLRLTLSIFTVSHCKYITTTVFSHVPLSRSISLYLSLSLSLSLSLPPPPSISHFCVSHTSFSTTLLFNLPFLGPFPTL